MSSSLYKQLGLSGAGSPLSGRHLALLVLGAGFLALTVFVVHPNEFRIQSFFSGSSCGGRPGTDAAAAAVASPHGDTTTEKEDDVRVLIGIQTLPSKRARRHLLRDVYSLQAREHPPVAGSVDVRFVFCNVTSPDDAVLVAVEALRYGDIIVLDCAENMDNGKTYTFFSTVARAFNGSGRRPRYDYVMKADDDIFLRLPQLVGSLGGMPREDMYYGATIPCDSMDPFREYMAGMAYALSWDLVQWIATSDVARNHSVGTEDMLTGLWLRIGGKGKNRFNAKPAIHDYLNPVPVDQCEHEFMPTTIGVHRLKSNPRWAEALKYFNFTAGLQPSKFYKID